MDEYAKAFGWVIMHWSRLEHALSVLVAKLAGTTETTAEIIYLPLSADSRKKLITALAQANLPAGSLQDKVLESMTRFDAARIRRNNFIHSPVAWVDPEDNTIRQRNDQQRGVLKKAISEVPLNEVRKLARDLNAWVTRSSARFVFIRTSLRPFPRFVLLRSRADLSSERTERLDECIPRISRRRLEGSARRRGA